MVSNDSSAGLWLIQGRGFLDEAFEIQAWGHQWSQFFGRKPGIEQVWVAWVDEKGTFHWISQYPVESGQVPFPEEFLRQAVRDGRNHVFQNQHKGGKISGVFPLEHEGRIIGLIGLLGSQIEPFNSNVLELVTSLSSIIAHGLFLDEYKNKVRLAESSISRLLQSSLDARNILPPVLEILSDILKADAIKVQAYNLAARDFEILAIHGWAGHSFPSREMIPTAIPFLSKKLPIWIEDLQASWDGQVPIHRVDKVGFRGYLALALIGHNEPSGFLEIAWNSPRSKHPEELGFLERVAEQIAFVMERSAILQDLRQMNQSTTLGYDALIEGLSRTLELRDFETEGHTRRVSQLTMRLVEHMKFPAEQWESIRRGSLLHDIGKLGIPDAILLKPGSLTDEERRMMELHVIYGHNILTPIINSRQILDIVLRHHERWDGTGYPEGFKGTQIPIVARLFAVVDVFDALTSDRPYRTAWSRGQAISYIKEQAGKQFDPLVVGYFLEIANKQP